MSSPLQTPLSNTNALPKTNVLCNTNAFSNTNVLPKANSLPNTNALPNTNVLPKTNALPNTNALSNTSALRPFPIPGPVYRGWATGPVSKGQRGQANSSQQLLSRSHRLTNDSELLAWSSWGWQGWGRGHRSCGPTTNSRPRELLEDLVKGQPSS